MTAITDTTDVVVRDDAGARRRRITRMVSSYGIMLLFAAIYVGPLLILIFVSMKTLPGSW